MEADIPCPHCHKRIAVQFEHIVPGNALACPNCGATIRFSGQDLNRLQETIAQLTRDVGDASVKVTVRTQRRRPWWKFWSR